MWEQNQSRVNQCVKFLTNSLDKNLQEDLKQNSPKDSNNLTGILLQMSMYLHEFNFYPSDISGHCCEVAFFTSLLGDRWNLNRGDKISFDQMFKNVISHCQGKCSNKTNYAVLVVDNWDDDIANFWFPNIEKIKDNGVLVEVRMMMGKNMNTFEL